MKSLDLNTTLSLAHGTPFEGGFYGGNINIHGIPHAVVWAPKAQGEVKAIWLPSYKDVPNAASCFDSAGNTLAMAEAGSPLAKLALDANINGLTDWCIPARDVLEMGYRYLKPTTGENSCSFRDGDNPSSFWPPLPAKATAALGARNAHTTTPSALQHGRLSQLLNTIALPPWSLKTSPSTANGFCFRHGARPCMRLAMRCHRK